MSTDSAQFSLEALAYLSGGQFQDSASACGNYSDSGSESSLTSDQKKSILENLYSKLSSLSSSQSSSGTDSTSSTSSTSNTDSSTDLISSLKEELSGFDASSATDQQVSDTFDKVMQTLRQAAPPPPPPPPENDSSQQNNSNEGLPAMLQAMGGIAPPFAWGISSDNSNSSDSDSANTLTTDQKKTFLAKLEQHLKNGSSQHADGDSIDQTLDTIKEELSGTDFSSATDQQVTDLFNEVTKQLKQIAPPTRGA
ncbi:hypothetical protein [Ferviditalea candida]|uniref:Uncharacterized protein n=1 Tax=Ferviditalea candida TaxID=3108399 RepID=A0ABU5ZQ61_9BACL|nr:hypothetical protein [Paenibacillaceae bacterium T2]